MLARRICGVVVVLALVAGSQAVLAAEARGKVESVTLYRGQALVTRLVPFDAPAGLVELVVTDLPERLQPDSLYAEVGKGAQVRAVRFRSRPLGQAPREEIRKLEDQIELVGKDLRKNQESQKRLGEQQVYLAKLQNFVAPTAQVELTKGVLDETALKELTKFVFEQMLKFSDESLALRERQEEIQKQLNLLQAQLQQLTRGTTRLSREALVFLEKQAGPVEVRLSYLVEGATWSPAYNLRAGGELKAVQVEYNALIQQMSGEDWENINLTLATASPAMLSDGPALAPLLVALAPAAEGVPQAPQAKQQMEQQYRQLRDLEQRRQKGAARAEQIQSNWEMNTVSGGTQAIELQGPGGSLEAFSLMAREEGSGLSVNYKLPALVSLASRADQQIVRIADLNLPAAFSSMATPLLTDRVYRQALVTNNSQIALLEGPSSVYLDGDFVGRGTLPVVAAGQKFPAGFGSDPQLRAWREFVSRNEVTQGGNKEVTFVYRLVLDNYKDTPVALRVLDRIPYVQPDIRVTMGEMKHKLSDDAEYLRAFRPKGILRWDVEVPAHSAATTAFIVEYSYKLEFDRNMNITPVTGAEAAAGARIEFQKMLDAY